VLNSLKKSKINNKDEGIIKKSLLLNLSSYKKLLDEGWKKTSIFKSYF